MHAERPRDAGFYLREILLKLRSGNLTLSLYGKHVEKKNVNNLSPLFLRLSQTRADKDAQVLAMIQHVPRVPCFRFRVLRLG
jgi:hypothetical protein